MSKTNQDVRTANRQNSVTNAIFKLNPNITTSKIFLIALFVIGIFNISIYCIIFYQMKKVDINGILNSVVGYELLSACCTGLGFYVNSSDAEKLRHTKRGNSNFFDVYPILPIQKTTIYQLEFKYWKYSLFSVSLALIATNVIFLMNETLKSIAGYFVIITLITILTVSFYFAERFFLKRWAKIGKFVCTILYLLLIFANLIDLVTTKHISKYMLACFKLKIFQPLSGIPMILLSIAVVPVILFLYKKYVGKSRKLSAWY